MTIYTYRGATLPVDRCDWGSCAAPAAFVVSWENTDRRVTVERRPFCATHAAWDSALWDLPAGSDAVRVWRERTRRVVHTLEVAEVTA